jgi:protein phosphatase
MGTTMTVAMLQHDGHVAIGHVGDSRAYRLREGRLEQLTDDHSLVAELVRRGELSPEEAAVHPQRSVITRALGTEPDVDVDAFTVEARDGDLFLLCSDGLTTMVDADTISAILARNRRHLEVAIHALIKAANDRGGDDNITAILFTVADGDGELTAPIPVPVPAIDPDDEDTLHPEDNVRLPEIPAPPAEVTMVVSADAIAEALKANSAEAPSAEAGGEQPEPTPGEAWPAEAVPEEQAEGEPQERASALRLAIALLVIVALAAAIVLLVLDALPR